MTLKEYMIKYNLELKQMAPQVNCSMACISNYNNDKRTPSHEMMKRIMYVTKGEVMPNDWFDIPEKF